MKYIVMFWLVSTAAFAQGGDFAKNKKTVLENWDKKIAQMQETRKCIAAASKQEDVKACQHIMMPKNDKK